MLSELLTTCGLNSTDQKVFVDLVQRTRSTAGQIAKRTGLKRPTVYAALDSLIQIGIATKQKQENVTYFSTLPAHLIPQVFCNRAKNELDQVKNAAEHLEPHLSSLSQLVQHKISGFDVAAISSVEAVYVSLEDTLMGGDFSGIFNPQKACVGPARELVERYLKRTAITKPNIRELAVAGPEADWYCGTINNPNHEVRTFTPKGEFFSDIILLNGSVLVTHYNPDNEQSIKITEPFLFQSLMTLFDTFWITAENKKGTKD